MSKAKTIDFKKGRFIGGITYYPYQITFGVSLRYWPSIFAPSLRIHFICFKVWISYPLNNNETNMSWDDYKRKQEE